MKGSNVDITDRKELNSLLSQLKFDTPALWGRLTAQPMIEHLIEAVQYTNGKKTATMALSIKQADQIKQKLVYGDFIITPGAKGYLSDATKHQQFKDLQTAINELNKEIDGFELFFKNDARTSIHPEFGPMNHTEWIIWHGKHFTHHFKQFGLIPSEK